MEKLIFRFFEWSKDPQIRLLTRLAQDIWNLLARYRQSAFPITRKKPIIGSLADSLDVLIA